MQGVVQRLFTVDNNDTKTISFPSAAKSGYRIQQKYDEYARKYLAPGFHMYKNFKDLFRGSISFGDYWEIVTRPDTEEHWEKQGVKISSINQLSGGNYSACYVIFNIRSMNFELKVVGNLASSEQSH